MKCKETKGGFTSFSVRCWRLQLQSPLYRLSTWLAIYLREGDKHAFLFLFFSDALCLPHT